MISRDEAIARSFRCAWRNVHLIVLVVVLGFACASAAGYWLEQVEIANAFGGAAQ